MKWSVSNIEIDLTGPPCVEVWAGWSAPSVGSVNLGGDPVLDLIDGGSGAIYERAVHDNVSDLYVDNMCDGALAIVNVTGLQAVMDLMRFASDQEFDDPDLSSTSYSHTGFVICNVGYNIEVRVQVEAAYNFDGITWTPTALAQVYIVYNPGGSVLLQNDSVFGALSVTDPGLVWIRRDPDGSFTYSHTIDGTIPFSGFGNGFDFYAQGTSTVSTIGLGADYPLATASFFSTAGLFIGDWTVAEALALL